MRFIIEQPVFADTAVDPLELAAFFAACRDVRRHLVHTDPVFRAEHDTPVNVWLRSQAPRVRDAVRDILQRSITYGATVGRRLTARVAPIRQSQWERAAGSPLRLSVADATRLAQAPLRLLVENQRSDGSFLRRLFGIAPAPERALLERAFAEAWIQVENGGGLEDLRAWVKQVTDAEGNATSVWVTRFRLWVMFDRDADRADRTKPSASSEQTCRAVEALGRRCGESAPMHRLERRAIENYLPRQTLRRWAEQHDGNDKPRLREAARWFSDGAMNDPATGQDRLRHSFNMKEGLLRDAPEWKRVRADLEAVPRALRDGELDAIYRGLPVEARRALVHGFGEDIGKRCFPDASLVQDDWLDAEVSQSERDAILRGIFERL